MKKFSTGKLWESNRFLQIISIIAATFCWLAIAIINNPDTDQIIRDIPVDLSMQEDTLMELGLSAIQDGEILVDVTVRGPRTVVGKLTQDDLNLTVNVGDVTEAGIYNLDVVLDDSSIINRLDDVSIQSIDSGTVRMRFDRLSTRTYEVEAIVNGLSTPPSYIVNQIRVTPSRLTVTGPEADLEKIDKVVVSTELTEPLTRTLSRELPIQLLDAQGEELAEESLQHLFLDQTDSQLVVQLLKTKILTFEVDFTVVPTRFPLDELIDRMEMSNTFVEVAGPVDTVDNYDSIVLGYIDIRQLTLDNSAFNFEVELPSSGFTNMDDVYNVLVEFNTIGLETASFYIEDIQVQNTPPLYEVEVLSGALNNVILVGEEEVLQDITADDIVVVVDLSDRELSPGQYSYPVKVSVPTKGLVWAVGEYSVILQVTDTSPMNLEDEEAGQE